MLLPSSDILASCSVDAAGSLYLGFGSVYSPGATMLSLNSKTGATLWSLPSGGDISATAVDNFGRVVAVGLDSHVMTFSEASDD